MKIFYWSPFISKVATVSSVIRSAESIIKYCDDNEKINVSIIDAIGEWNGYRNNINSKINIIKLNNKNYFNSLPRGGFLKSRFSYLFIFFINFFKLKNILQEKKPDFLIVHLITSLPIFLSLFLKKETKIILRLSGLPKLNVIRYLFWKLFSKKIHCITCPTIATYNNLIKKNIFDKDKIHVLHDPAILLKDYSNKKFENIETQNEKSNKVILAIGRLTHQKNFSFLITAFKKINEKYPEYVLQILGDGEQKSELTRLINKLNLQGKVNLLGFQKNVYKYLINSDCFVLSSLWEDPGFVLLEAGLSNTIVISSDCNNGPQEILENGKNGFLFQNNNLQDFLNKFDEFKKADNKQLVSKKINLKKYIKKFTLYSHFNTLNKIIKFKIA
tara:strand:- start:142 stop:1302 length:1161 start_codon:yes stop_codon:yes gene_type:complete